MKDWTQIRERYMRDDLSERKQVAEQSARWSQEILKLSGMLNR
jgi:hypothetical protein